MVFFSWPDAIETIEPPLTMGRAPEMPPPVRVVVDKKYKMVIVFPRDVEMSKGKSIAQGSHAAVLCYEIARMRFPNAVRYWLNHGYKKIVLEIDDTGALENLYDVALERGLPVVKQVDAGLTELTPNTPTCIAIFGDEININQLTRRLPLMKE